MSILSDRGIIAAIRAKRIAISPYDPEMVQPVSYDVRLGHNIQIPRWDKDSGAPSPLIDVADGIPDDLFESYDMQHGYRLDPGCFILGSTLEYVALGDEIVARLEGKSTLGRLGLMVHVTAGLIDPGFDGRITMELKNVGPFRLRLYPGMAIGQLVFSRTDQPVRRPYGSAGLGSHYQGQTGATIPTGNLMKLENPE